MWFAGCLVRRCDRREGCRCSSGNFGKRLIDKKVALACWGMGGRTPVGILTSETRRA